MLIIADILYVDKEAVITVQIFGARETGAIVLSQAAEIENNAKNELDSLIYETAEFGANSNPEFKKQQLK